MIQIKRCVCHRVLFHSKDPLAHLHLRQYSSSFPYPRFGLAFCLAKRPHPSFDHIRFQTTPSCPHAQKHWCPKGLVLGTKWDYVIATSPDIEKNGHRLANDLDIWDALVHWLDVHKVGQCQHVGRVAGTYFCQSECLRQCIFKVSGSCFRNLSPNVLRGDVLVGPTFGAEHPELVLQTKD